MENIKGVVVSGKKVGRLLGFPTANIKPFSDMALASGIYAGYVIVGATKYPSALYLAGNNIIEAFIFDFSGDLYDQEVEVEILKKIREKQDFKNSTEAADQIAKDVLEIKKILL